MTNNYYETTDMKSLWTAIVIGGLIGGTIGLLYAPQSGRKTREFLMTEGPEAADRLIRTIMESQEKVLDMIEDAQSRMELMNDDTRQRLDRLQEIVRSTVTESRESLKRGYTEVKDVMKPADDQNEYSSR